MSAGMGRFALAFNLMTRALFKPCPCDSGRSYADCCGPFHAGVAAPSPEALMRSRYSAYVLGLLPYLLETWHPSTVPGDLTLDAVKWLGLEVQHSQAAGDVGVVAFVARWRDSSGRGQRMQELSRFVREDGRWFYIDGDVTQA